VACEIEGCRLEPVEWRGQGDGVSALVALAVAGVPGDLVFVEANGGDECVAAADAGVGWYAF